MSEQMNELSMETLEKQKRNFGRAYDKVVRKYGKQSWLAKYVAHCYNAKEYEIRKLVLEGQTRKSKPYLMEV